jgi:Uma2 family endonuclease
MSAITSPARSPGSPSAPRPSDLIDGDKRLVIRNVGQHVYHCLAEAINEDQHLRLAYDGKDLELMTTGHLHERYKELLGQFVNVVTLALDIDRERTGESTWDTQDAERGLQADLSYYFDGEKLRVARAAFARKSKAPADYPSPDLAIEIDLSPPKVDRRAIYAALRVAEVWKFDGRVVVIEQLQPDGTYAPAESSRFLAITAADILRWLVDEDVDRPLVWERRLLDWALGLAQRAHSANGDAPQNEVQ